MRLKICSSKKSNILPNSQKNIKKYDWKQNKKKVKGSSFDARINLDNHSNSCSPENARIRAVKFRFKICGRIYFDLGKFRPMSSQKFVDLGEIRPIRRNFARYFWGEI
jgi:hypothetical protein